jgi:hypothetical protein
MKNAKKEVSLSTMPGDIKGTEFRKNRMGVRVRGPRMNS